MVIIFWVTINMNAIQQSLTYYFFPKPDAERGTESLKELLTSNYTKLVIFLHHNLLLYTEGWAWNCCIGFFINMPSQQFPTKALISNSINAKFRSIYRNPCQKYLYKRRKLQLKNPMPCYESSGWVWLKMASSSLKWN